MRNPLTDFCKRRGLNLAETEILLGVPYTQLSRVAGGYEKPSGKLLARLAELGEDPDEFMARWLEYVKIKRAAIEVRPGVVSGAPVVAKGGD